MPACKLVASLQDHHLKNGYQLLYTPHVAKAEMWKTSGHLDFYSENMYDRIKVCSADMESADVCPWYLSTCLVLWR